MIKIIKKELLFSAALMIISVMAIAGEGKNKQGQPSTGDKCFDEHTHIINFGIGFGGGRYYGTGLGFVYRVSPAFSLTYEQAYPKKLGPGYLGVGAYVGYRSETSRYDDYYFGNSYYYKHHWNHMILAARGVYHWDVLNAKNAEVYGGAIVGVRISTYNYSTNDLGPYSPSYKRNDGGVAPVASLFAGARWYFVPNFAVFGEAGYGISYLTAGISLKF